MNKNAYRLVDKFNCCGRTMVTVIMNDNKSASVMTELEYNRIIETEREHNQKNRLEAA